jgi:integrase
VVDVAVQRELVGRNVAHGARARRRPPAQAVARSWSAEELRCFLTAVKPHRLYIALHLAAHTGMRRGEIVGLKWSDLDRASSRLSIARTLQNVGGRPVEFGCKTRTSRRTVELDENTMRQLDRWRRRLRTDGLAHGQDDWMFSNTTGPSSTPSR